MPEMAFSAAIDGALERAMTEDPAVITFGEDVIMLRRNLFVRFGPQRVLQTPISESAFLAAGVGAAMSGLRPVVEIMLVDFVAVAFDAILNEATKIMGFSGNKWQVPIVIRAACGGGYGDGGQHEQCLWGLLAGMPGVSVVVPSNPADAAGLMLAAIANDDPVVFLEHKLLADYWLDYLGGASRDNVAFDIPAAAVKGKVEAPPRLVAIGKAVVIEPGDDVSIISLGVSLHRSLQARQSLLGQGIRAEVIDLRSVTPLDKELICQSAAKTERVLVVDEDFIGFGLSGEIAAIVAEAGIKADFARVCTEDVIPFARHLEDNALPNVERILKAAQKLMA
jgi:pyruvate/2-oxoglutarate/acetoin dehydrogenase E1 component